MSTTSRESESTNGAACIEAWLTVQNLPQSPWVYPIETEPKTFGRGRSCAIRLLDQNVSREHAMVWQKDGRLYVRDLHSTNGTRVNGKLVREQIIVPGDVIQVGHALFKVGGPPEFKPSKEAPSDHGLKIGTELDGEGLDPSETGFSPAIPQEDELLIGGASLEPVRDFIAQAARVDAIVMIYGETGTGKELVALAIHRQSARVRGPFVARNCGAFPESLLENELFGHEPGAFTGATTLQRGVFDEADGGTLLLDEIAETPPAQQAKLLRVIEEQSFQRVGGQKPVHVNVRLIAATNRDLTEAVTDGQFRRDLYYRLQVLAIRLPPLRGRPGDIQPLAEHFVRLECDRSGMPVVELSAEALRKLEPHDWPGNVRELRNTISRAVVLSQGTRIGPEDIVFTESPDSPSGGEVRLDDLERRQILKVIASVSGNKAKAATILGIDRSTLRRKLERIRADEFGGNAELK